MSYTFSGQTLDNTYHRVLQVVNEALLDGTGTPTSLAVMGSFSANTIFSGQTNLYDIFAKIGDIGASTYVQPGLNTYTGGTSAAPTVNISAATLSYLSATTISADTIYSGLTPLFSVITGATFLPTTQIAFGNTVSGISSSPRFIYAPTTTATKFEFRDWVGIADYPTIYLLGTGITASVSNYSLTSDGANTYLNAPTGFLSLRNAGNIVAQIDSNGSTFVSPLNVSNAFKANSITGTTVSASTFYSGTTPLASIINNIATGATYLPTQQIAFGSSTSGLTGDSQFTYSNSILTINGGGFTAQLGLTNGFSLTVPQGFTFFSPSGILNHSALAHNFYAGNVGIGTAFGYTPTNKLEVIGNVSITGTTKTNSLSATTITVEDIIINNTFNYRESEQETNKILTVDVNGVPKWQYPNLFSSLPFFFTNTASPIVGSYKLMKSNIQLDTLQTISNFSIVDGQLLVEFITESGYPNINFIPAGVSFMHLHAANTNNGQETSLYYEIYKRTTGGTETLIGTSDLTEPLTLTSSETVCDVSLTATTLNYSDLIVVKVYGHVVGAGSAPDISLYVEDGTTSRLQIPSFVNDAQNFIPYSGATSNVDLDTQNLKANIITGNTIQGQNVLSGNTDLYDIFAVPVDSPSYYNLTLSGSATAFQFSATTIIGDTILSGSTNLYNIFSPTFTLGSSQIAYGSVSNTVTSDSKFTRNLSTGQILIGNTGTTNFSDYNLDTESALVIARTTDSAVTQNAHGFVDATKFYRSNNGYAYNSYRNNVSYLGSANYNHYSLLENNLTIGDTAIVDNVYGHYDALTINSGASVTSRIGFTMVDYAGTGTLASQSGIYIPSLVKATNNWAIDIESNDVRTKGNIRLVTAGSSAGSLTPQLNFYHGSTVKTAYVTTRLNQNSSEIKFYVSPSSLSPTVNILSLNGDNGDGSGTSTPTATVNGNLFAYQLSATTLSGGTILSGATNLYSIFAPLGTVGTTYVQPGTNISTGGTSAAPIVNVVDSPSFNNLTTSGTSRAVAFSATTVSGSTLYSGSTDLSSVFAHTGKIGVTSVGAGHLNITTGGTDINPTIILASSPSLNGISLSGSGISARAISFSATTLSGATIYSASTDLSSVFAHSGKIGVTSVGSQNLNITTGGTDINPTIILAASPSLNGLTLSGSGIAARALSFSATTLSGATIYSASTDLNSVFAHAGKIGVTSVGSQNLNITTGGTDINPTIILAASPALNGIILSGAGISARALSFSATTLSGSTLYSGSTDLSSIFAYPSQIIDPSAQGNIQTGGTAAAPIFSVVDSPSFSGLLLSGSGISARALSFSATTLSGATLYSGSTDLSSLFAYPSQIIDPSAQGNIQTGGTAAAPIFSVVDSPSFNGLLLSGSGISARALSFSATTLSGATLYSGSTDLSSIFAYPSQIIDPSAQGNIQTGGTAAAPIFSVVDSPSFSGLLLSGSGISARALSFSATTLSGATLYSGSTDLSSLFAYPSQIIDPSAQGNIQTGGTAAAPIFSVVDSPSFNGLLLSGSGISARALSFSATTLSGATLYSGSTDLSSIFAYPSQIVDPSAQGNIQTGGTATAPIFSVVDSPSFNGLLLSGSGISARALSFSATTLSGATIYSASTDLNSVFAHSGKIGVTSVGAGHLNITTGGTDNNPTILLAASPSLNGIILSGSGISARALSFSATTLSGGTLFSGNTNLYSIFAPLGTIGTTYVQPGTNISTGGTASSPIVNVVDSPSFNNLTSSGTSRAVAFSATTISGGTLISGSTNLYNIFQTIGGTPAGATTVQPGSNITTGGTASSPIVNVVDSPSFNNLTSSGTSRAVAFSATTISGGTIMSGSTDLSLIFVTHDNNTITNVQPGTNTTTGGTATSPSVNVVDNPSFAGIQLSGSGISARALSFSATTLSGATIYSASTDLSSVFAHTGKIGVTSVGAGHLNITTGGTDINPTILLAASPSLTGILLSGSGISARALSFSATTLSGSTLYSGSTDLSSIFAYPSQIIDPSAQGNIQTGGTAAAPIFSVVDSPSFSGLLLSGSGISARALSFSATTLSGATIYSASTDLNSVFAHAGKIGVTSVGAGHLNITTGGTDINPTILLAASPSLAGILLSGSGISARALTFSATTLSGATIYSASTDLNSVFAHSGKIGVTSVGSQNLNITTGGTDINPTIILAASPSLNGITLSGTSRAVAFSATTLSGGTILSGSTNLYSIFQVIGGASAGSTTVQPGSNITTGGTASSPIVSVVDSPSFNNLTSSGTSRAVAFSATTISGGTIYSGSTDLSSIFAYPSQIVDPSAQGNIQTGGTAAVPIFSVVDSPSFSGLLLSGSGISARALAFSATTLSGATIYSASTDLNSVFAHAGKIGVTSVGAGHLNITTGGTDINPTILLAASPSLTGILLSGSGISARALSFSATTLSGATIYSGSTDLSSIFAYPSQIVDPSAQGNIQTGGTAAAPIFSVVDSPSFSGLLLSGSGISARALSFSATTLSGATLYSASTDLNSVFAHAGKIGVTSVGAGHLNITTGGTDNNPTILLAASPSLTGILLSGSGISARALAFSATTLSGTTLYSGSTDISSLFAYPSQIIDPSAQGNIQTGGTAAAPIFSVVDSPSFNGLTTSGTSRATSFSATTLSASTLFSGSTNLYSIFAPIGGGAGITAGQSVGAGNAIFKQVNGSTIEIRSISAGTNVTITTGDTITINATAGSGSFTIVEAEIDFGSQPVRSKTFTVTDASVNSSSKIIVNSSGNIATGRLGDDWEWDAINFTARAGTGQFTVTAFASGRVRGARKIFYTLA